MNSETVYCPTCHRQVRTALTTPPLHGGQAVLPDAPELVCLDTSDACGSGVCPVCNLPHSVMVFRLARSGLDEASPAPRSTTEPD